MLAKFGHRAQLRKEVVNGVNVRYFEHVRKVALIMLDCNCFPKDIVCPEAIQAALLHDILEDTEDITAEMLELIFGKEVAFEVMMLTKRKGTSITSS